MLVALYEGGENGGSSRVPAEILVGEVSPSLLGDLMVLVRSNNRAVPSAITVRETAVSAGMAERQEAYVVEEIRYEPRPGERAVIIGKVERSITPS